MQTGMAHPNPRTVANHNNWAMLAVAVQLALLAVSALGSDQVAVTELPARFKHAESDEDLELLYKYRLPCLLRTCLEPDLALHQGKQYSLSDIADTIPAQKKLRYYKHLSLAVVKQGVLHVASLSTSEQQVPPPTPRRVAMMQEAIQNATRLGVVLPDCVFILNTFDKPRCPKRRSHRCKVPVLSPIKSWHPGANTTQHTDILMPAFDHVYQTVAEYPWPKKARKAVMRAAMQNGMSPSNTRLQLVHLSHSTPAGDLLDAGITQIARQGMQMVVAPQISVATHAKWRYIISTDGYTANYRLGRLLGINSVVLKEESPWIEYYYRAMTPGEQFVPFTETNVLQVLQNLNSTLDQQLQQIAHSAQQFQQLYLTQHAKVLYLKRVLTQYLEMFPYTSMSDFVDTLDTARLNDIAYLTQRLRSAAAGT